MQEKATACDFQRLRDLLKVEGITFARLSELSQYTDLNGGRGYAAVSIRTLLVEERAQPELVAFVEQQVLQSMSTRIAAIEANLNAMKEEYTAVRALLGEPALAE